VVRAGDEAPQVYFVRRFVARSAASLAEISIEDFMRSTLVVCRPLYPVLLRCTRSPVVSRWTSQSSVVSDLCLNKELLAAVLFRVIYNRVLGVLATLRRLRNFFLECEVFAPFDCENLGRLKSIAFGNSVRIFL